MSSGESSSSGRSSSRSTSPSRSRTSSSEREVAEESSTSSTSKSSSSESSRERIEAAKKTTSGAKRTSVKDDDGTLIKRISSKLKVDAETAKKSASRIDLAAGPGSPKNPTLNASGKSELHPDLFLACFEGNLAKVKKLVQDDPKLVKVVDPEHSTTLLHHAASGGSVEVVKYLLDQGVSIDQSDNENVGAIHYGAIHGQADVIKELIKKKTKLLDKPTKELEGSPAFTPLFQAVYFNHPKAFTELLKGGSDITIKDGESRTVLHLILTKSRVSMFDEIIAHEDIKKIVNEVDDSGNSPLHLAVKRKSTSMVETLIKLGANPNAANADGTTPLILATQENLFNVVKSLIAKGAKVLAKDKKGKQALDYASELGHEDIQYYLVNSGGDVSVLYNGKNKNGQVKPPDEPTDKYGFYINQPL